MRLTPVHSQVQWMNPTSCMYVEANNSCIRTMTNITVLSPVHPIITLRTAPERIWYFLLASYVLDMGEPVKIMDLAKQLIRFYGYEPGVNMEIKIVGLRPGEKLYEELMMDEEQDKMRRTEHNKIFVAPPRQIDLADFYSQLQALTAAAEHNDEGVVKQLAEMIPTFTPTRSNLKT